MRCECGDSGCPAHKGTMHCGRRAVVTVFRVDMEDETGTIMCDACAADALESGVFTTEDDDAENL
jgi:hypothetical protein